jgi:hypothetical protein
MDFNVAPYYNDYQQSKDFYSILFKPSVGVQVREINQLQSILQNQITQFGNNIFQNGSMVVPGGVTYNNSLAYVNVAQLYGNVNVNSFLSNLVGLTITGQSSGVSAVVVNTQQSVGYVTLFIQYVSGSATAGVFAANETLMPANSSLSGYATQVLSGAVDGISETGVGSAFSIDRGIYFLNGYFAVVAPQTIILSPFTNNPTMSVGFLVEETIVTSQLDSSLYDNSNGTSNYSAPGADRYQIVPILTSYAPNATQAANYIQITSFENGVQIYPTNSSNYSIINDMIAGRTYDEAGNFTVNKFPITVKEYRNNSRGAWSASTVYMAGDVVSGNWVALFNGTSGTTQPSFVESNSIVGDNTVSWIYVTVPYLNGGVYAPSPTDTLSIAASNKQNVVVKLGAGKSYVNGYKLQKIASTPLSVGKPRTTNYIGNAVVNPEYDNYILITDCNTMPDFTQYPTVNLYNELNTTPGTPNGTLIGTAHLLNVTYQSGTIGTSTAVYRASIGQISMNSGIDFARDVKQMSVANFTANINPVTTILTGSVTASASTTVTGTGTLFLTQLMVNDWISIGGVSYQVTAIASNYSLTVSVPLTVTGSTFYLIETAIVNSNNNLLLFPLGRPFVQSVRNYAGAIVTSYNVMQSFISNTANTSGVVTIAVKNSATDVFSPATNPDNYITINTTTNAIVNPTYTLSTGNQQITVAGLVSGDVYTVIANVLRSGSGTEKTKTLLPMTTTITSSAAAGSIVYLNEADGYTLTSVMQDTGTFAAPTGVYGINITSNYSFNNGQRNSVYAPSYIQLLSGAPAPTAPIQVAFTYFSHSSTGDYFTVNSYTGTLDYEFIPAYNGVLLSDVIDFRSRIDVINNAPSVINGFPAVGYDIETSYSYYQGRSDLITLDSTGTFSDVSGTPSDFPQLPPVPANVMVVYNLYLSQYVNSVSNGSVSYKEVDNSVYQMSDIAALDQRITNIEYYTSLNMLEQTALNAPLTDSNGTPLYKNGIAVDSFNGVNSLGDVTNIDYMCSMDVTNAQLLPFYTMTSNYLTEQITSDSGRLSAGYVRSGNLLTLPFTSYPLISQTIGTGVVNLNPFSIYGFIGSLTLNPSSDNWFSSTYIPNQVVQIVDNYSLMNAALQASGVLGTHWNAWQTTWSGVTNTKNLGIYVLNSGSNSGSMQLSNTGNYGSGSANMNGVASYYGATYNPNSPNNITITGSQASQLYNTYYSSGQWVHGTFNTNAITTQTNQVATGLQTTLVPQTSDQIIGTQLISQTAIPYMRQRHIVVSCSGLKPSGNYYAYFDNVNVTSTFSAATKLIVAPITGQSSTFNTTTNIGAAANTVSSRQISGDSITILSTGDVLTGATSGATGVLAAQEFNISTGNIELFLLNVIGTFSVSETVTGSISTSKAIVTSQTNATGIVPTSNGNVYGLLLIQNTSSQSYQCGVVGVVLSDNATSSNTADADSYAFAQYSATGILETEQNNIVATTTGHLVQTAVTENQTLFSNSVQAKFLGYCDPVAQSFLVTQSTGIFVTGVDLFFSSADSSAPVTIQIVDMLNGTPGQIIVPNSSVTIPASSIAISSNGSAVTHATFASPVYLSGNTEYAIEIISNSNNYNVYVANMGDQDLITGQFVSTQPYAGMLFESKNSSTWIPNATSTLKFVLYAATFSTNASTFNLVNTNVSATPLAINPFASTSGSNTVQCMFISHGLNNGDNVTISGAIAGNGITISNGNYVVSNCTLDTFSITASTTATATGQFGGASVLAYGNVQYDLLLLSAQELNFSGTNTSYSLKTTSGKSINGSETPYITDSVFTQITNNENIYLPHTAIIANAINASTNMSNNPSIYMQVTMQSSNSALSPVIDMSRVSTALIRNKVNSPTTNNETVASGSSTYSKYVTTPIQLANAANNIHVLFGYTMPPGCNILVYYKTTLASTGTSIAQETYTKLTPDSALVNSNSGAFSSASFTLMGIASFDILCLKIVMQSTIESNVPKLTSLQIICTT